MGYCTWNAFYHAVDHDRLVSALRCIGARADQPLPGWVLIDDGWQAVDAYGGHGRLHDMYADENKFPGQLRRTVDVLSGLGIRRIGVWHALWGYWGGIDPAGPLAQQYALVACRRRRSLAADRDSELLLIAPSSIRAFYDAFYAWLHAQGVSFVKVDYQGAFEALDSYADASPQDAPAAIAAMRVAYYDAMEAAALKHFGPGSVIYCMAQSPFVVARALQHQGQHQCAVDGVLPDTERMAFRNSEDYVPEKAASHGWHIYCNMANTVWSRTLGDYFTTDWDMFQPGQPEIGVHVAARALSGGMVYVTATDADVEAADLRSVAGSDGSVMPHQPLLLDDRCLFADMTAVPAILAASFAAPKAHALVVALFNVSSSAVVAPVAVCRMYTEAMRRLEHQLHQQIAAGGNVAPSLRLAAMDGLAGDFLAIHQHSTGRVQVVAAGSASAHVFGLQPLACDAVTVAGMTPIRSADRSATLYAACVGDTGRYGGAAAVERSVCGVLSLSVPDTPRSSPPPPPPSRRQWHVRARIAAGSRQTTFVFSSREAAAPDARQLPITVRDVRVSGGGGSSGAADWHFDERTGALRVVLHPSAAASSVTVSLCA
ncbi:hypothetical protein IWQ57_000655 [Coemansia nantahalensis]|uniref:Uncharacterized protein n=1 Tax=Coemansia nantahalensis TaxID=2789366 RepID=A0ACC1K739_9FUNG|nr:hypothetical protein IWQ57_000655 [Coemansia nantahalensis]